MRSWFPAQFQQDVFPEQFGLRAVCHQFYPQLRSWQAAEADVALLRKVPVSKGFDLAGRLQVDVAVEKIVTVLFDQPGEAGAAVLQSVVPAGHCSAPVAVPVAVSQGFDNGATRPFVLQYFFFWGARMG